MKCPPAVRSRRQQIRWDKVAASVTEKVGADNVAVRAALREAIEAERDRE